MKPKPILINKLSVSQKYSLVLIKVTEMENVDFDSEHFRVS